MSFCAAVAGRYFKETIPEIFTHFSTFYAILVSYDITLGCSNRMKRFIGLLMALTIAAATSAVSAAELPAIHSETYVVMDAASGQVLLERGAHNRMYPASITKILTSALALEHLQETGGSLDDKHTMTYEATHSIDRGSTHIALTEEEVVTVRDLLYTTMIESANDSANGLAEYTAGTLEAFPELMNRKAAELGALDSHFANASGLHDPEHYTSAYDMALITKWALGIDGFRDVFGATEYTVPVTNKQPKERKVGTHHHMLVDSKYYYEGTTGGKLGWTPEARHTLVTLAERNGLELICVVMRSTSQYEKYEDAAALLDACFADYSSCEIQTTQYVREAIPVYDGEDRVGEVSILPETLAFARPATVAKADIKGKLLAPERYEKGAEIAPKLRLTDREGRQLAELPLAWEYQEVQLSAVPAAAQTEETPSAGTFPFSPLETALIVFALLIGVLFLIREHNLRKRRKQRKERAARLAAGVIDVAPEFQRRPERRFPAPAQQSTASRRRCENSPKRRYPRSRGG